jgi:LysR family transcriptional regulator, nitrogen assimilation regulatory protein
MDIKQLEYFVRVAELGSFTRASIALNVAQSALSRQVRLLEVELRQSLLLRNGRGVTMTDAGKVLAGHARGVLHQIARAREELGRVRGTLAGRVALGLPPSLTKVLTVPLIHELRAYMPEASLSISEGLSLNMQEALANGRLDIALIFNPILSADVNTFPLLEEELFLVRKKEKGFISSPIPLRAVAEEPLVIPPQPNSLRMIIEVELANIGRHPRIALEIGSISAILDLVADGAGCAVLSRNAVTNLGAPGAFSLQPIVKPRLCSKLLLAVSSLRPATLTQQAVQDLIIRTAGPLLLLHKA